MKNKTKLKIKKSWTRKKNCPNRRCREERKKKKEKNSEIIKRNKKNIRESTNQYLGWWWSKSWETIKNKHVSKTACFFPFVHKYLEIHENS